MMTRRGRRLAQLLILVAISFLSCRAGPPPAGAEQFSGKDMWAAVNIHIAKGNVCNFQNDYFTSPFIPVGTKVQVLGIDGEFVRFISQHDGREYLYQHGVPKYIYSLDYSISRILVPHDTSNLISEYAEETQSMIRSGRYRTGMTKEQVATAVGYPSTIFHRGGIPQSIDEIMRADVWRYPTNRWGGTHVIQFVDGRAVQ